MTAQMWGTLAWTVVGWLAAVALPPLFVFGVKWLAAQANLTTTDKRSATLKLLAQVALTGVTYAEQTIAANPAKKAATLQFVQAYLNEHNIKLSVAEIDAAIESAVYTATSHGTPAAPIPPTGG